MAEEVMDVTPDPGPEAWEKLAAESGIKHPLQEKAEMDIVLAVKHLLALEDHLREFYPENPEEEQWRNNVIRIAERLRTDIMSLVEEKDERYHCMGKHIIGATGALEEVSKLYHGQSIEWPQSADIDFYAEESRNLQNNILSKLWGHEIENCKRCK